MMNFSVRDVLARRALLALATCLTVACSPWPPRPAQTDAVRGQASTPSADASPDAGIAAAAAAPQDTLATSASSAADLEMQRKRMRDVMRLPGVVWLDLDERCGCLVVGVVSASIEPGVRAFVAANAVNGGLVQVRVTGRMRKFADLQDGYRPTKGGMQIRSAAGICTMGMAVFSHLLTKKGLLTNSHCTEGPAGGSRGTWFAQPGGAWFWGDKVGEERIDPYLFTTAQDSECPVERSCRRSDAAFIQFDQGTLGQVGRLARPSAICSLKGQVCSTYMLMPSDDIRVVAVSVSAVPGDERNKIGRTTGWTRGSVSRTCVSTNVANQDGTDSGITLLCQNFVGAVSDSGDSGSPVFSYRFQDSTAQFDGLLWGGSDSEFVYSPVSNIVSELGGMAFHE